MTSADPGPDAKGLSIRLPKVLSAVEEGRLALLDYLEPFDLDSRVINRIEVVLEELVSNVIRHADSASGVELAAYPCEGGICLCVEDDGAAFNPLEAEDHEDFDTLEDAQIGGLGIPLIKRLSHSVSYRRVGSVNRTLAVIAA